VFTRQTLKLLDHGCSYFYSVKNFIISDNSYCQHLDNLNGHIVTPNNKKQFFFKPGSGYKLECDSRHILVPLKNGSSELTWNCTEKGEWIPTSTCIGTTIYVY